LQYYVDIKIIVNTKFLLFRLGTVPVYIVKCNCAFIIHCEYELKLLHMVVYIIINSYFHRL